MNTKEIVLKILTEELGSGYDYEKDGVLNVSGIDQEVNRNIVMRIEDECKIDILDKDAENLYTLKDILDYIEKKKKPKKEGK